MSSDERREQIIEAAIAVFGAKGYVGTTTDDVARAASVSQPYVVRLFGTKENLFLAALGECARVAARRLPQRARMTTAPHERGELMGAAYLDLIEMRGLHQILSHAFLLGAHPVIGPAARARLRAAYGTSCAMRPGFTPEAAQNFLATGMLINTMVGLRMTEEYGKDAGMTELLDECFPFSIRMVLDEAPRVDDPVVSPALRRGRYRGRG